MSIPEEYQNLPGFRTVYSEGELRIAIALAEVMIQKGLSGGSGGGGGGATSANQLLEITEIAKTNNTLGATSQVPATDDSGSFSVIQFIKRISDFARNIRNGVGNTSDSTATTDTGTFSLIALYKRYLSSYANRILEINNKIPSGLTVNNNNRLLVEINGNATATDLNQQQQIAQNEDIKSALSLSNSNWNLLLSNSNQDILYTDSIDNRLSILQPAIGTQTDSVATSDSGTFSLISLIKRLLGSYIQPMNTNLANLRAEIGTRAEFPASTDDGVHNIIPLIKRISGNITSINNKAPNNLTVNSNNRLLVDTGTTSGDASASNQIIANTHLQNLKNSIGGTNDASATNDFDSFSLIAYVKRISSYLNTIRVATDLNTAPYVQILSNSIGNTTDAAALTDVANASFISLFRRFLIEFNQKVSASIGQQGDIAATNTNSNSIISFLKGIFNQASSILLFVTNISSFASQINNKISSGISYTDSPNVPGFLASVASVNFGFDGTNLIRLKTGVGLSSGLLIVAQGTGEFALGTALSVFAQGQISNEINLGRAYKDFTVYYRIINGSFTNLVIDFEYSLDGTFWFSAGFPFAINSATFFSMTFSKPTTRIRAKFTSVSGAGSVSLLGCAT